MYIKNIKFWNEINYFLACKKCTQCFCHLTLDSEAKKDGEEEISSKADGTLVTRNKHEEMPFQKTWKMCE